MFQLCTNKPPAIAPVLAFCNNKVQTVCGIIANCQAVRLASACVLLFHVKKLFAVPFLRFRRYGLGCGSMRKSRATSYRKFTDVPTNRRFHSM